MHVPQYHRTNSSITRLLVPALCLVLVFGATTVASACPSCKAALNGDGSQGDLARGIYYSVLFMMSMPFAIVGSFAGFMYRAVKREQRRVAQLQQPRREDSTRENREF
jgi:hypothetical protein